MVRKLYALILDTVSIQSYIFSTNNLRENVGASYIVEDIYESHLKAGFKALFPKTQEDYIDAWKNKPEVIHIINDSVDFEVGYIGGGNALVFFKSLESARDFVRYWTKRLLVYAPGVVPAAAIEEFDFNDFSSSIKNLFKTLRRNKYSFIPETIIRKHGITADCARTGYSREVWCRRVDDYVSSVASAKIEAADRANEKMQNFLRCLNLQNKYKFTDEIDKLGQSKGEDSHIAVVHIDGNDISDRVVKHDDLVSLRRFSLSLRKATEEAFKEMLKTIDKNIEKIRDEVDLIENDGKIILPLRPIIIGGDDITFVSEGRLGIWLAELFLRSFDSQSVSDNDSISASAGIAITKTKYPFYRGYRLSEELCRSAKDKRKKNENSESWIDFHIAYGGFSGELEEIRSKHYRGAQRENLLMRPYSLSSFRELLKALAELRGAKSDKQAFPRSKLMELREVLHMGRDAQNLFMEELKARGLTLPKYEEFIGSELVRDNQTPYLDMIELTEFYPEFPLKELES